MRKILVLSVVLLAAAWALWFRGRFPAPETSSAGAAQSGREMLRRPLLRQKLREQRLQARQLRKRASALEVKLQNTGIRAAEKKRFEFELAQTSTLIDNAYFDQAETFLNLIDARMSLAEAGRNRRRAGLQK